MRPDRRAAAAVLVAVCAVACTACASSGNTDPGTTPAAPQTSAVAPNKVVPFDPADNVRSDVAVTACGPGRGFVGGQRYGDEPGRHQVVPVGGRFHQCAGVDGSQFHRRHDPRCQGALDRALVGLGSPRSLDVACLLRQAQAP